ncbi:MAG: IS200/IS605 family transposase [Leptospiraceae bacterium]|nr:IS200/IS605 family transposase [Leptospiraceae bacterium]
MARCFNNLNYHLIFVTKNREKIITREMHEEIKKFFSEKEKELELKIKIANGVEDHIHILTSIPPKYSISEVVKHLKGYTSFSIPELYWSRGYSCLTVDNSSLDRVYKYIKNQQEHHRTQSYEDEIDKLETP